MNWIQSHVFELVTLAIALYAAILSTIQLRMNRSAQRRQVRVAISHATVFQPGHTRDRQVSVTVANEGHQPIQVTSLGVKFRDNGNKWSPILETDPVLPYILQPGEKIQGIESLDRLSNALAEIGGGRMWGMAMDALGNEHLSRQPLPS